MYEDGSVEGYFTYLHSGGHTFYFFLIFTHIKKFNHPSEIIHMFHTVPATHPSDFFWSVGHYQIFMKHFPTYVMGVYVMGVLIFRWKKSILTKVNNHFFHTGNLRLALCYIYSLSGMSKSGFGSFQSFHKNDPHYGVHLPVFSFYNKLFCYYETGSLVTN